MGRGRKLALRVTVGFTLLAAAAGTWAAFNWSGLKVRYAAHRLTAAATNEERAHWAERLAASGDEGINSLTEMLASGDSAVRMAAATVLARHLETLDEGDPRAAILCGRLLESLPPGDETACSIALELVPTILKRTGSGQAARCREVVTAGLKLPSIDHRLAAIRMALHPHLEMRADLLPLLSAPEPEIRRAALFAVGPATDGEPVISDEELFRWLHDPDEGVRKVCADALVSRGRTDVEIALGRRLAHPLPAERLKLLLDLRYDDDVRDPEPWLERLSRDASPGVRAGSVRVAVELAAERRLPAPPWVAALADADPDPTVRRVAGFYRQEQVKRQEQGVRTVGGP